MFNSSLNELKVINVYVVQMSCIFIIFARHYIFRLLWQLLQHLSDLQKKQVTLK